MDIGLIVIPAAVVIPIGILYALFRGKFSKSPKSGIKVLIAVILLYILAGFIFFLITSQNKPFTLSNLVGAITIWPLVALYYIVGFLGGSVSK